MNKLILKFYLHLYKKIKQERSIERRQRIINNYFMITNNIIAEITNLIWDLGKIHANLIHEYYKSNKFFLMVVRDIGLNKHLEIIENYKLRLCYHIENIKKDDHPKINKKSLSEIKDLISFYNKDLNMFRDGYHKLKKRSEILLDEITN